MTRCLPSQLQISLRTNRPAEVDVDLLSPIVTTEITVPTIRLENSFPTEGF